MGQQRCTATVSEIASALGKTVQAIHARVKRQDWQPTGDRVQGGGDTYDIDAIKWRKGEAARIKRFVARRDCKVIPLHHPSAEDKAREAAEKERQRLAAHAEGMELFNRLPAWQKRGAAAKIEIIQACDQFIADQNLARTAGQDQFCHEYNSGRADLAPWVRTEIRHCHPATLRAWIAAEYELGMNGLADQYGNRKGQSKIETYITGTDSKGEPVKPLVTTILALIAQYPHIKPKRIAEYLPDRCPDAPTVSAKSIERWIDGWKAAHPQEWDYLVNPDNWKNKHLSAAGQMDEGIRYIPNARWEIDATPADLLLTDGRNKIIGLIDVGTRRLILQVTPTEKALDNAKVARRGILAWGVPKEGVFITDQGNPYKSELFRRFLKGLDIEHEFCEAFSGDRKPFIERAFRTFSHDLVELLPGYCGHSVADRKAIEARKSFAARLMKKGEVIEAKMTAAELQAFCDRWCADYHNRVHSTLGKSPNQVVNEWPHAIHRVADERALDVLLSPVAGDDGWRTVAKKGIKINGHWFIHGEFGVLSGQRVQALETEDIGRVIVNRQNEFGVMEFVGVAEAPELTGISRAEVAAVTRARQKRVIAQVNELKKELKKELKGEDIAGAVLSHREKKAADRMANVAHFPRPTIDYTTPGLQAAAQAAQALDGRQAPVEHAPEVSAARERLQAEMAKPVAQVFEIPHEASAKYRMWSAIDGMLTNGSEVSDEELRFYEAFRGSRTWRAFRGVEEDIYSLRRE